MLLTLFIDGIEREFVSGTLTNEDSIKHRTVLSFNVKSDGSWRPSRDQDVELMDGSDFVFAGFVESVDEQGYGGEPISTIDLTVHCVDLEYLADRRALVNTFVAEGTTLEDLLTTIAGHLATDGVTVDPAQVTGPILPYISVPSMSASELLNMVTQITGYVWEIYPSGANRYLRAYLPTTTAAPFNVIEPTDPTITDIKVEPPASLYANRVVGLFGSGNREIIDHFVGDGSTTVFDLNYYPLIAHRGYVNVGGTLSGGTVTGGANETLSIGGGGTWDYDPTTGQVTRTAAVANGVDVYFQYTAQFPVVIIDEEPSEQPPVRDVIVDLTQIFERQAAEEALALALQAYLAQPRTVRYSTFQSGLEIGMSQTITIAKRAINASGYISALTLVHLEGELVRFDVEWIEGDVLQMYWGDIYHEWSELGGGGTASAAPTTVVAAGPGQPNRSVQFNRNGVFGGDAAFTYDEVGNNLVMGEGSDITAANPQNCAIFGSNCHITD